MRRCCSVVLDPTQGRRPASVAQSSQLRLSPVRPAPAPPPCHRPASTTRSPAYVAAWSRLPVAARGVPRAAQLAGQSLCDRQATRAAEARRPRQREETRAGHSRRSRATAPAARITVQAATPPSVCSGVTAAVPSGVRLRKCQHAARGGRPVAGERVRRGRWPSRRRQSCAQQRRAGRPTRYGRIGHARTRLPPSRARHQPPEVAPSLRRPAAASRWAKRA